ncbi:CocE/NonD family hydrolase [Brevundimonas sp. SORGH_AS_0993]|uniref:CocE/NonD family hydrolase n=1 Tax=Brevundimonas sp. SORGH_AS_0993 TaxID=3041794 RepID=UPI0027D7A5D6|nr:CocE/NonD family hydrolase [Brevundimonas sp. SORGH_AS_0993]
MAAVITASTTASAQQTPAPLAEAATASQSEIPDSFRPATPDYNYVRREVMIPMRDGVRLHTVIIIPKGLSDAPIILNRTPYDASRVTSGANSTHAEMLVRQGFATLLQNGYILVSQDVRGKYGSEGDYVMNRPIAGPLNTTGIDHATDAYDTIEWLVHNVPETNGRVATMGNSYDGFTVTQSLINPHPALKAAVPMMAMVDGWMGDDWFHNGAFRWLGAINYSLGQEGGRSGGPAWPKSCYDDYVCALRSGSAAELAERMGVDQTGFWKQVLRHPSYDGWWQAQAVDKILAKQPLKVPTLWVDGLWDQEDIYGTIAAYRATEAKDVNNDMNFLVAGPWMHGGAYRDTGANIGPVPFDSSTSLYFQRHILLPFLDAHLKTTGAPAHIAPVSLFESGVNEWRFLTSWPTDAPTRRLYLQAGGGLAFQPPASGAKAFDEYTSDPAHPVPYIPRPVRDDAWRTWLASDQRPYSDRADVVTYVSEPLTEPVRISGNPQVHLFASTTGTDSDWVVKLIDVYPDEYYLQPEMGGYQLAVSMDIFRGRYRESLSTPKAITPNRPLEYKWALPAASHTFLPGHRIMVQVQSSWFPLYDRNPQTFVPNIMFAKPEDYRRATQRVYHDGDTATFIELPVASSTAADPRP